MSVISDEESNREQTFQFRISMKPLDYFSD